MAATLKFDIVGDSSRGRRELAAARSDVERFGRATQGVGRYADQSSSKLRRFGSAIGSAVRRFGPLAIAAAGAGILKIGYDSLKAASDTEQAFGGIESVFKKNSDTVKKWANDAANSVGLARSEYGNLAVVLGASLKNSGIENYAQETRKLIKLGADLAATFGGTTADAVSALSSLLRGETDPIERYGVAIKQSDVNARLAAKGQDKLTGAAKKGAEQLARLELLAEQTGDAVGQFKREANTAAGAQQRLSAKWLNAKDTLGQKLLPVAARFLGWLGDAIDGKNKAGQAARRMGDKLVQVAGWIQKNVIPDVKLLGRTVKNTAGEFDKGRQSTKKWADGLVEGRTASERLVKQLTGGKGLEGAIIGVSVAFPIAARKIGEWVGLIQSAADAADRLASKAFDARDAIVKLATAPLGAALRAGQGLGGLLRDVEDYPGLARGTIYGGGGGGTSVSVLSSPQVRIEVDSQALARLFRVIVRDEVARAVPSTGRVFV